MQLPHEERGIVEVAQTGARRIALIVASMSGGGVERAALNLAAEFRDKGYRVDLVLVRAEGPLLDQLPEGVNLVKLEVSRAARGILPLRGYLRSARPDLVIGFAFAVNLMVSLSAWGRLRPPRLVLSVHSTITREFAEQPPLWRAVLFAATRLLYRRADHIVCVSQGAASDLYRAIGLDRRRIQVIHNPVIVDQTNHGPKDEVVESGSQSLVNQSRPLVLAAGRLTEAKNFSLFLSAFALVRQEIDCRAMILGIGPQKESLKRLADQLGISDYLTFAGFQADPWPFYRCASVFVLSSSWEGLPTVLIEAMSAGTPVVATDCPHGPREILCDGRWGMLVAVDDVQALAAAIIQTLRSGGIDARLRSRDFTATLIAEEYLTICGMAE